MLLAYREASEFEGADCTGKKSHTQIGTCKNRFRMELHRCNGQSLVVDAHDDWIVTWGFRFSLDVGHFNQAVRERPLRIKRMVASDSEILGHAAKHRTAACCGCELNLARFAVLRVWR